MKTGFKLLGVIALAAFIVVPMATCGSTSNTTPVPLTANGNGAGSRIPVPLHEMSAADLVDGIRVGWNLGNTLDTVNLTWLPPSPRIADMEQAWGNPTTTQEHIDAVKNAGFNTIRIPVSWSKCTDGDYNIRADWMERVKQVVDYAVNNDMFIILNTHHDEGIFKFRNSEMEESQRAFRRVWEQIAETFQDYNEKLIFEDLNEPRTIGSPAEWRGGTAEERNNLNTLHQLFVDTVRASGGKNDHRILMVSTYSASATVPAMEALRIPHDPANAQNKIIVSIHAYEPYNFALNNKSPVSTWSQKRQRDTYPITERVDRAYDLFISKGIPVIMGEFAALDKNNVASRAAWAEYYVQYAKSRGAKCVWWDDGGDFAILDRRAGRFKFPRITEALMRGSE